MKRIVLFFALCSLVIYAQGQEYNYVPLVNEECKWSYCEAWRIGPDDYDLTYYQLTLSGDTIINGFTYKKVFYKGCSGDNAHYTAAVREEEKKVYTVKKNDREEKLAYDFTLEEGEYFYTYETGYRELHEVKLIDIAGSKRKMFVFDVDTWIEGVGSLYNMLPFPLMFSPAYDLGFFLNYQKQGGELVYRTDQFFFNDGDCPVTSLQNPAETQPYSFNIDYARKKLSIELNGDTDNSIELVSITGKKLYACNLGSELSADIDISGFTSGVYLLVFRGKNNTKVQKIIL